MKDIVLRRLARLFAFLSSGSLLAFAALLTTALYSTSATSLAGTLSFAAALAMVWIAFSRLSAGSKAFGRAEVWALMLFCFCVHVLLIRLLPAMGQVEGAMTYDPLQVLRSMQSGRICFLHDARNQGWCNYEVLMSAISAIFGGDIQLGRVFQSLCCVAAIYPVFRMAEGVGGRGVARATALAMGLSPSLVMYSMVLTSEFLSASLMAYALFFFMRAYQRDMMDWSAVRSFVVAGCLLALSDMFKVIGIVFLAAAVAIAGYGILCAKAGRTSVVRALLVLAVFIPTFKAARHIGQHAFSELAGDARLVASAKGSNTILYELVLGLNVKDEGYYSASLAKQFLAMGPAEREKFAKDRFKADWRQYPGLMAKKFVNIHGSTSLHHGSVSTFKNVFRDKSGFHSPRWITPLADAGSYVFATLFLLGSIGLLLTSAGGCGRNILPGLFAAAVILGFAAIEQLIEGHGRYKTAIYPFYFMILPYCRIWLEADNPLYMKIKRLWAICRQHICH